MSAHQVRFGAEDLGARGGPLPARALPRPIVDWSRVKGGCDGQPDQARIVDRWRGCARPIPLLTGSRDATLRSRCGAQKINRGRWGCCIGLLTLVIRGSFWHTRVGGIGDEVENGATVHARDRRVAVRCSADAAGRCAAQGSTITLSCKRNEQVHATAAADLKPDPIKDLALSSTWPIARSPSRLRHAAHRHHRHHRPASMPDAAPWSLE